MRHIEHPPAFGNSYVTSEVIDPPVRLPNLRTLAEVLNSSQPTIYWLSEHVFDDTEHLPVRPRSPSLR
ncbi:MAG TPA: hypothetical protein VME46_23595 [Acidimicrobiales bacterium]|nr:hypothetical protein [Acidimicrobiales bacterium]